MALSLKLVICLLFVACAYSEDLFAADSPSTTEATTIEATTIEATTAEATTTEAPTTEASTTTGDTVTSTGDASTPTGDTQSTIEPATNPPQTTESPGPCASNPCGRGSSCQDRADETYICLCLAGIYSELSKQCVQAKTFPGELTYGAVWDPKMEDTKSDIFQKTEYEIQIELVKAYKEKPEYKYAGAIVKKLSEPSSTKVKADPGIVATVDIFFEQDSPITTQEVITAITGVGVFTAKNICELGEPCDKVTTTCKNIDGGYECGCLDEYIPTDYSDHICIACPKGEKAVEGSCKKCGFGYSGFNCEENWQLILVIVGCVLGVLLLTTIILLVVGAVTSKKKVKKAKSTNNTKEKSYTNPATAKTPQVSNGNGFGAPRPAPASGLSGFGNNVVPRIPRATANDSWDRNTNLEMVPSNSRQNLLPSARNTRRFDNDDEDTNPYSRPMKPQNNPYAMGRPQINPYASSQGQSNPYFRH